MTDYKKELEEIKRPYYVYAAYGVDNELLYIGKGKGDRWKHCTSGISSSRDLNRYYFANGECDCIKVKILKRFDDNKTASSEELDLIKQYAPTFNILGARVTNLKLMDEVKEHYRCVGLHISKARTGKGSKLNVSWFDKYKTFVSLLGYRTLKDGVNLSKESVKMHHCSVALAFYDAVVAKGSAPKSITSLFCILKVEKGVYKVKINGDFIN